MRLSITATESNDGATSRATTRATLATDDERPGSDSADPPETYRGLSGPVRALMSGVRLRKIGVDMDDSVALLYNTSK